MSIKYPTKIKSVITKLTQCTQKALQSRKSRIQIELPPGVDYGIETSGKGKKAKGERGGGGGVSSPRCIPYASNTAPPSVI
jgi:hypothetical protein